MIGKNSLKSGGWEEGGPNWFIDYFFWHLTILKALHILLDYLQDIFTLNKAMLLCISKILKPYSLSGFLLFFFRLFLRNATPNVSTTVLLNLSHFRGFISSRIFYTYVNILIWYSLTLPCFHIPQIACYLFWTLLFFIQQCILCLCYSIYRAIHTSSFQLHNIPICDYIADTGLFPIFY